MINAFLFAMLAKMNLDCRTATLPALIFAIINFVFSALFGQSLLAGLVAAAIYGGVGYFLFWLLQRYEDGTAWWVIVFGGAALFFFVL